MFFALPFTTAGLAEAETERCVSGRTIRARPSLRHRSRGRGGARSTRARLGKYEALLYARTRRHGSTRERSRCGAFGRRSMRLPRAPWLQGIRRCRYDSGKRILFFVALVFLCAVLNYRSRTAWCPGAEFVRNLISFRRFSSMRHSRELFIQRAGCTPKNATGTRYDLTSAMQKTFTSFMSFANSQPRQAIVCSPTH